MSLTRRRVEGKEVCVCFQGVERPGFVDVWERGGPGGEGCHREGLSCCQSMSLPAI